MVHKYEYFDGSSKEWKYARCLTLIQHQKLQMQPKCQLQSHLTEEKKDHEWFWFYTSVVHAAKDLSNTSLEVFETWITVLLMDTRFIKYGYLIINKCGSTLHTKNELSVILLTNISSESFVCINH